ncbi:MAG: Protein translocase membrane subunit SecG [Cytophagales bacterium]|jgi:preprotein translocase subunit SecG|nr:preprotein translocase subunit SecG [Bacteroidota bacterium]MBS1981544.1 preprotein translocase subunit SecG [Bacteroidota bacterium]WHZ08520.1 MAG: Protein translocase membrane subunit SecG [Cytophagales bacterium]
MYILLIGLTIVSAVLLVLVVLAQNSKGGGLSSQFGGSGASNLIGVKKTGDFLERATWALAISIMVFSLAINFTTPNAVSSGDELIEKAKGQQSAPVIPKAAPATDSTKK